MNEIDYAAYP